MLKRIKRSVLHNWCSCTMATVRQSPMEALDLLRRIYPNVLIRYSKFDFKKILAWNSARITLVRQNL